MIINGIFFPINAHGVLRRMGNRMENPGKTDTASHYSVCLADLMPTNGKRKPPNKCNSMQFFSINLITNITRGFKPFL